MKYSLLHSAVKELWGKPDKCELCAGKRGKRFEWSNKNHMYRVIREEWWMLCSVCHNEFDREHFGKPEPWNKGQAVKTNDALAEYRKTHGAWNKGKRTGNVPRSAFKTGNIPWNHPVLENGLLKAEGEAA